MIASAGCGRKGPPLPPLARVPDSVSQISARRIGSDVFVSLQVPAQNVDQSPPTITHVDLFAFTTDTPPQPDAFIKDATRVASVVVAPPMTDGGRPPRQPQDPPQPGDTITVRDPLDAAALVVHAVTPAAVAPTAVAPTAESGGRGEARGAAAPDGGAAAAARDGTRAAGGAAVPDGGRVVDAPPAPPGPRRYYMAVAFGPGDRSLRRGSLVSVSIEAAPPPPGAPSVTSTADALEVVWPASAGASGYNIYRDDSPAAPEVAPPAWASPMPAPLNSALLPGPMYTEPVEFGRERCYRVRAVSEAGGGVVESDASDRRCFTARDTFPPSAPADLTVLATADGITLKWSPSAEKDVAGYLLLRGRAGDATLLPITPTPVSQTQFIDRDVMPGGQYVYAVRAVDSAQPEPNVSPESEREAITAP